MQTVIQCWRQVIKKLSHWARPVPHCWLCTFHHPSMFLEYQTLPESWCVLRCTASESVTRRCHLSSAGPCVSSVLRCHCSMALRETCHRSWHRCGRVWRRLRLPAMQSMCAAPSYQTTCSLACCPSNLPFPQQMTWKPLTLINGSRGFVGFGRSSPCLPSLYKTAVYNAMLTEYCLAFFQSTSL